jgi:hypothetical protein
VALEPVPPDAAVERVITAFTAEEVVAAATAQDIVFFASDERVVKGRPVDVFDVRIRIESAGGVLPLVATTAPQIEIAPRAASGVDITYRVDTSAAVQMVAAETCMKRIVPGSAIKPIASAVAPQVIVAFATLEPIIAVTSLDDVVIAKADEKVFAAKAKDLIGVMGAVQRVVDFSAGNVSHGEFSSPCKPHTPPEREGGACFATGHWSGPTVTCRHIDREGAFAPFSVASDGDILNLTIL